MPFLSFRQLVKKSPQENYYVVLEVLCVHSKKLLQLITGPQV